MRTIFSFEEVLGKINQSIENISYSHNPKSLFEPISYILALGGKRVRPALSLMSYNLYQNDVEKAMPTALAVEVFHNFTLLHDDLMDKADIRRGKPTVHIKWYDNLAILSGDAMLIEAYKELCKVDAKYLPACLDIFSKTATEICCGQQLDMEFEQRDDVTIEEYIEMIRLKTAVLLGGALQMGAIVADASKEDIQNLYTFGIDIGLAFQLMDDLLDVYGDSASFGKRIGGDILCNKKTYLLISALSDQSEKGNLLSWINKENFDEEEKIKAVTAIYNKIGIKEKTEATVQAYYDKAIDALQKVKADEIYKQELYDLAKMLKVRNT